MKVLEADERVSSVLYDEFISVYEINLDKDTYKAIKLPNTTAVMNNRKNDSWSEATMSFAEEVSDDTREIAYKMARVAELKEKLKTRPRREYVYRLKNSPDSWRKATVIYAGTNSEGDTLAVFTVMLVDAFAVGNEIYLAELDKKERQIKIQQDVFSALSRDYINVYSVRPKVDILRVLKLEGRIIPGLEDAKAQMGTAKIFSYNAVFGQYIEETVHPDDRNYLLSLLEPDGMDKALGGKDEFIGIYRAIIEGVTHHFEYKIMKLSERDVYIIAFRNVDSLVEKERVRSEELANALKKADIASKAKSTFLFNMSHDIRTPMNAIIGFAELMAAHWEDRDLTRKYLDKLTSSSRFLLSLINNVLEMARIESGKTTLDETVSEAGAITADLYNVFEEDLRARKIEFTCSANLNHRYIYCDATKMREIILNILSNAIKYTPDGGKISMTLREIPCDKPGYITIESVIEDTGIGMSKNFLPHIFEPFSRERNATESKITGTGLGMPIVKDLVNLMGGTITAESELGKGSRFTTVVTHRIVDPKDLEQLDRIKRENERIRFDGKRVLLTEDNELNAEIAETILADAGMMVEVAEDGDVCLEMLKKNPADYYNLILMDVQMPRMNGYDAARAIRALDDPEKASIPIVALTANAFAEDKAKAMEAGMNGHLAKPISIPRLTECVKNMIR